MFGTTARAAGRSGGSSGKLLLAMSTVISLPAVFSLNPKPILHPLIESHIAKEELEVLEKRKENFRDILRKVGVRNFDKIELIETEDIGPTTVGCDLPLIPSKAIVLVPKALLRAAELTEEDLPIEERQRLLEATGTLVPTEKELQYILGHEAAHLAKNHSLKTAVSGFSTFWGSYLLASRCKLFPKTPVACSLFGMAATAAIVGVVSVLQEREADLTSAARLGCAHEAKELVEKKIQQNLWLRREGNESTWRTMITSRGNDLLEWEHPSVTWQLNYLSQLEQQQHHQQRQQEQSPQ